MLRIDPFSVSKHCDDLLWAELSWRQKESPDRFTNASYEVCLFFNNNWRNSDFTCICKVTHCPCCHDCYLKRLTLTDETRLADPHTLLPEKIDDLTDSLRLSDSHLTCIVETNSLCLSTHEDIYIYICNGCSYASKGCV